MAGLGFNPLVDPAIQQNIDQQYQFANLLRQQSMTPDQGEMVSGRYVAPSITQRMAKLLQAYSSSKYMENANQLQEKQWQNQIGMLKSLAGMGSPEETAQAALTQGAMVSPNDASNNNTGGLGPTVQNADRQTNLTPIDQGGNGGIYNIPGLSPQQKMAMLVMGNGDKLAEATLKQYDPTDLEKELRLANIDPSSPMGQKFIRNKLNPDIANRGYGILTTDENGNRAIDPASMAQINMTEGIKAGYGVNTMKIPVYLPGGDQITVEMNPMQAHQYNTTGQLPAEIAASIPGLNQQQPANGQPPAQQPIPQVPQNAPVNNPGNLRPNGASTGFQQFATPQEGLAALDNNLQSYGKQGVNTLEGIISKWAPPTENNTQAYIADVSQRLGVDPKQPLDMSNPAVRQAIGTGIMLHEQGSKTLFASPQQAGQKPVVGRTQSQNEGIEQAAQKAEKEKFAQEQANLRVNAPTARAAVADATTNLQRMQDLATKIMNDQNLHRITGVMGSLWNVPGSAAADLDASLNSLKSQVGFSVLQAMRDASKTGGALGAISDRENELLQKNLTALDKSQSPDAMRASLNTLIEYAKGAQQRIQRGYSDTYERVIGNQGVMPTQKGAVPINPPSTQNVRRYNPATGKIE